MKARLVAALALALAAALPGDARPAGLQASARLARELGASRRAEVTLRYELPSLPGNPSRPVTGTLALEAPDRVRLDVAGTGERLVARGDGGEWLQPSTKQLLRFGSSQAAPALRWWRVLLGETSGVRERRLAPRRFVLVQRDAAGLADSATVWLDARGLPVRLELPGGDGTLAYRLSGWRFGKAKGSAAFRLDAPAGYETIELP
jgi:hypothetical protein